jgi:hypothetical protein
MQILVLLLGPVMRSQIRIVEDRTPGGDGVWVLLKLLAVKQPATQSKGRGLLVDEVIRVGTDRLGVLGKILLGG